MRNMAHRLLARGDFVAVESGRLIIKSKSGREVTPCWLKKNHDIILREICDAAEDNIFTYQGFSTGRYGSHKSEGVALRYLNLATGKTFCLVFNAELTRARNTAAGQAGSNLLSGQFRVTKGFAFTGYWVGLGLPLPRKLSEFHSCMGKLGTVLITAQLRLEDGIDKKSVQIANVSYADLLKAFGLGLTGNYTTDSRQYPDNYLATLTDKRIPENLCSKDFSDIPSAYDKQYELSNQVSVSNVIPFPGMESEDTASIAEWLDDYGYLDSR